MNTKLRNGLIFGGLGIALVSVIAYFSKQFKLLREAVYTISGGVIHSIGLDNVKMTLFFKVINESDLTIQISNIDFDILVNKMFVTKIKKDIVQTLYSKSETVIKLDVEFNPRDLLRVGLLSIEPILNQQEKLIITTKGTLDLSSGVVFIKKFPFSVDITLKELLESKNK